MRHLPDRQVRSAGSSGALNVGFVGSLVTITPLGIQPYFWSQMMGFALYDPLVNKNSNGDLVPVAAESWDTSNPLETIINVRPGMYFQNGQPVTAQDVVYSIAARSDPALIAKTSGRPLMSPSQWVSAEAVGNNKVVVKTTARVRFLENPQPVLVIPNNAYASTNLATTAVGSGPFMLKQFLSGTSISMIANPHYWAGKSKISQLDFKFFGDISSVALSLRSGEIDAIYNVQPLDLSNVTGMPHTKTIKAAIYGGWWIIQMGAPPLDNPAVRRALRYCFNMPLINQAAFAGLGTNPWNPFLFYPPAYQTSMKPTWSYDPDKAKSLLAAAGVKKTITVPISGIAGLLDSALGGQIIQQGFQAAGVDSSFEDPTSTAWLEETYTKGTFEGIAYNAGNIPFPFLNLWDYLVDPDSLFSAYTKGAPNPLVSTLYNKVESGTDAEEPALLKQAQNVLLTDAPAYFMFGAPVSLILPDSLEGVGTNGFGDVWWNTASFS